VPPPPSGASRVPPRRIGSWILVEKKAGSPLSAPRPAAAGICAACYLSQIPGPQLGCFLGILILAILQRPKGRTIPRQQISAQPAPATSLSEITRASAAVRRYATDVGAGLLQVRRKGFDRWRRKDTSRPPPSREPTEWRGLGPCGPSEPRLPPWLSNVNGGGGPPRTARLIVVCDFLRSPPLGSRALVIVPSFLSSSHFLTAIFVCSLTILLCKIPAFAGPSAVPCAAPPHNSSELRAHPARTCPRDSHQSPRARLPWRAWALSPRCGCPRFARTFFE